MAIYGAHKGRGAKEEDMIRGVESMTELGTVADRLI